MKIVITDWALQNGQPARDDASLGVHAAGCRALRKEASVVEVEALTKADAAKAAFRWYYRNLGHGYEATRDILVTFCRCASGLEGPRSPKKGTLGEFMAQGKKEGVR